MKNKRSSFLEEFFGGNASSGSQLSRDSKFVIEHDKWDDDDYRRIHEEVKDFGVAEQDLKPFAGEQAVGAMADEFYSLLKAIPVLKTQKEIRPSYMINAKVMEEQMKLPAYESLRAHSVGDNIGSALASIAMEPHLEAIYDRLEEEKKEAERLEKMLQEHEQGQEEQKTAEQLFQEAMEGGNEEEAQDYQEQANQIAEQLEKLREQIAQGQQELQDQLDGQSQAIRMEVNAGLKDALKDAEAMDAMGSAWGVEPGQVKRMDAKERLELAKKLNSEKFRRLAEIIGPMMRLAWAEQQRKTNFAPEEPYDVTLGRHVEHMLASEYVYLNHPVLRMDWMARYVEGSLLQYELRGTERVAKGGIIFCEDGSGSMSGDREIWAKAVGLALLHVSRSQNRPFTGIHFGSPGEIMTFEFAFDRKQISVERQKNLKGEKVHLQGSEAVIDFAELFFGGGTDFVTPLSRALDQLREEHAAHGAVKGDIVFCTDGACGVPDKWLEEFKAEQERLGFRVFGIVIGGSADSEPLKTICDGRVVGVQNLIDGSEISHIFRSV